MPLISLRFIALSIVAVFCSALLRRRLWGPVFLGLNLIFIYSHLTRPGMASTLAFCAAGYAFIQLALAGKRWAVPAGTVVLVAAFLFMRNYAFLPLFLPRQILTNLLATVGLSFLLFRILHVLIDAGAGSIAACPPLLFANYTLNFTTFLIGPLWRFEDFLTQWNGVIVTRPETFSAQLSAVNRVLRGMVKKFVLAEFLATYTAISPNTNFRSVAVSTILLKGYTYYLYLYCDFSGYCDIAIGVGTLMGLRPPENFNFPFFARNMADFWLRVHRTLTEWLTDYVFTPLYASSLRRWNTRSAAFPLLLMAVMATMIVSGLWHGTTAAFLIFGLMHGGFMIFYRAYEHGLKSWLPARDVVALSQNPMMIAGSVFLTFNAASIAYLCFILSGRQLTQVAARFAHLL